MRKEIAIAIDVSGSMENVLDIFGTDHKCRQIHFNLDYRGGTMIKPINDLARQYKRVYWFTDGYFGPGTLADNVTIINVMPNVGDPMNKKWNPEPTFVLLRGLEHGNRFYTTNGGEHDPRYLANGKLAYEIIGYAETSKEAEGKLGEFRR
jgi:hypothetical protein